MKMNIVYENTTNDNITFCLVQENNVKFVTYVKKNGNEFIDVDGNVNRHKYIKENYRDGKIQLDNLVHSFNEAYVEDNITKTFKSKILSEEDFVLKVDAPIPETNNDLDLGSGGDGLGDDGFGDSGGEGDTDLSMDDSGLDTDSSEEVDTGDNDADPKKSIQKWTGKLAQKLRDYTETDRGEMDNYVFKSLLAALDWKNIKQDTVDSFVSTIEDKFEENANSDDIGQDNAESELLDDGGGDDLDMNLDLDSESDDLGLEEALSTEEIDKMLSENDMCPRTFKLIEKCGCKKCSRKDKKFGSKGDILEFEFVDD